MVIEMSFLLLQNVLFFLLCIFSGKVVQTPHLLLLFNILFVFLLTLI